MKLLLEIIALTFYLSTANGQCKSLRKSTNKFTPEITVSSPTDEAAIAIKVVNGNTNKYFLNLTAPANAGSSSREGVIILLADGQKLEWPNDIVKVTVESYHPRFSSHIVASSYIELSQSQVESLAKHRITDYRLGVFDWTLRERLGEDLRNNIDCMSITPVESIKYR